MNIAKVKGLHNTQLEFLEILKQKRPDYCFMQLQNPYNMSVEMIREMAKYTKIINWTGDVRQSKEWYDWFENIGREIFLTLFCNTTDVEILRNRGVNNVGYLQIGFDHEWYKLYGDAVDDGTEIVFCANNYETFELSKYRLDVAKAMMEEFGNRFKLFGMGWHIHGIQTQTINNEMEAKYYRGATAAISISNFLHKRYHSDRLLRIMGCGAVPLSHYFPDMEMDFCIEDGNPDQQVVVFHNINEAVDKAKELLDSQNTSWATTVGLSASWQAHANHKWENRVADLLEIIHIHEQPRCI